LVLEGELRFSKQLVHKNLIEKVDTYRDTLAPTLLFEDSITANEIVTSLAYNPLIKQATLSKFSEKKPYIFAYLIESPAPVPIQEEEIWGYNSLTITKAIKSNNELLGYFSITRSLEDLISKKDQFIRFGLLAWFIIIIIIVMITLWYQSSLTRPIQELMKVSERISIEKNYSIRAQEISKDEFGQLTKVFNQMMDSLNHSDQKLRDYNTVMEKQVQLRTEELSKANKKLVQEIVIKEKAHGELLTIKERLNRQEKLASVGQVSSNIAHELRNPMAAIRSSVYFLRKRVLEDKKFIHHLDLIDSELSQSDEVIERLLELTKGKKLKLAKTNLQKLISDAFEISNSIQDTTLETNIHQDVTHINVDALLFRQIFTNLTTNSIQAMSKGGIINVTANPDFSGKENFYIRFIDTGIGIPKENWGKIFDPLFTNKKEGIGLGLSLCKDLIERHGGTIEVEFSSIEGTCFLITLSSASNF
jgi:signal transduction histidine kinase